MARLPVVGGAYEAASVIASAQRCLNLFAEPMPEIQGEPAKFAYYPTPGLRLLGTLPQGPVRAIRQCTTGGVYVVAGSGVYRMNTADWTGTLIGNITAMRPYPVSMQDNGLEMLVVDGTAHGWKVTLASDAFAQITETAFYGADRVDLLDTFFVLNKPNTPQFYSSDSLAATFDPLWFANAESYSDLLVTLAVAKREIWLLGERTTEVWFNSGAADFPFQRVQSVLIEQGCRAKYSVATHDDRVYWLARDRAGQGVVLQGANYESKRISTYAIERELARYERIDDAEGYVYSLAGHAFYVLSFPHADTTWVYDITTGQWHEWLWIDNNGVEHRHRAMCSYAVDDLVVLGDHKNGNLYALSRDEFTDNGQPIKRQRSYPHIINDANRVYYRQFIADIESGNPAGEPIGSVQTLISCSFTAGDGTLIEDYHNTSDTHAAWTLVSGTGAQILDGEMQGLTDGSTGLYSAAAFVPSDYTVQFRVIPSRYDGVAVGDIYALARSTGEGTGYRAMVAGDGTQYWLTLGVEGGSSASLAMGTLASGFYVVTMTLQRSHITLMVQRASDMLYLSGSGLWASAQVPALTLTDSTYTATGLVMIGGDWVV